MSASREPGETPSRVSILVQVERACDEFEALCRAGKRPEIEEFLARASELCRDKLLSGLLEIELEWRQKAGETLQLEQYLRRFPENAGQVEALFRSLLKPRRLGDYELLEMLGQGGMGIVYRARQVFLNQIVAVKVLPDRYLNEPQAVARFRREMQSAGALDHPNIVRAFNAGEADGVHYLVMEYVDGVTLDRLVSQRVEKGLPPLSVAAACEVVRQAASGLQHAHENKLIHRDVKPANLILSRGGVVKLLDLGLAKVRADLECDPLTQTGITMGTLDYMAPEQWEKPDAVDHRADIYSLGCTLFFLLVGRPPYGGKPYDTSRKKLMAHVVAPVPSLVKERPVCPEDLDQILARMMAKEPEDRFDRPGEVAEAVGRFADAEELAKFIPGDEVFVRPGMASTPQVRSSGIDTAWGGEPLRFSEEPKKPQVHVARRHPWYCRRGALAAIAAGLLLAVGLGVWGWNRRAIPNAPNPPKIKSPAADLALLPGLNGQWWFDEMPWWTPFVRQAVFDSLQSAEAPAVLLGHNPSGYLDPNTAEVQKWLWEVVRRSEGALSENQKTTLRELKSLADANLDDSGLASGLSKTLERFVQGHQGTNWPAADRHTEALLRHKLAALQGNGDLARQAQDAYDEALRQYAEAEDGQRQLRLLCLADSALLASRMRGDFKEAKRRFEEALGPADAPVLFRVETLTAYGAEAAAAGEYNDSLFLEARKVLDGSEAGRRTHPLAAHVCERYAWSLMDQWKVEEASAQFQAAYHIRWTNQRESQNPFAAIHVLHNRHGQAMSLRYRGNAEGARRLYKTVAGEAKAALDEARRAPARPGQQRYLRDLRERWANSMERWADCELYGGAASGATVNLARAADLYQQARNAANDAGSGIVMACKGCIVTALHGDAPKARAVFDTPEVSRREVVGADRQRAALMRQVTAAVLKLKEDPAEGRKSLRAFLDQFRLNPTYADRGRETLELQWFCAELLLSSGLEAQDPRAVRRDLKYLDPLLARFRGRKDMLPLLRRYYELAIRACGKDDLVQLAQYVVASRATERQDRLRSDALLLFYFSPRENFAVFLAPGGGGKWFPIQETRQQIKAASRGPRPRLPDELVKLAQAERRSGRAVEVSWCDTMCWASEDDGLSDSEWPFGDQLDLAALRKAP